MKSTFGAKKLTFNVFNPHEKGKLKTPAYRNTMLLRQKQHL